MTLRRESSLRTDLGMARLIMYPSVVERLGGRCGTSTRAAEGADAPKVGALRADMRKKSPNFSLADAFTLHLATKSSRRVAPGDPDFKGLREAEFIG